MNVVLIYKYLYGILRYYISYAINNIYIKLYTYMYMPPKVCRGCGKLLKHEIVDKCFCSEICKEVHEDYLWRKRNNDGIPSKSIKFYTKSLFGQYRTWARERNIEFNITYNETVNKYLEQDGKCALCGEDIFFVPTRTASIDRIDSNEPYVVSNIQWVHKVINKMKNDLDKDLFIEMCKKVSVYNE